MNTNLVAASRTELSNFLDSMKGQMEKALPKHMTADRMCRLAMTAFSNTPKLQECTMQSIAACLMNSSQLGLEIGVNGQAYMIPYGKVATFVPGWKGLISLVNRAGRSTAWTGAVFEGDTFEWELGSNPFVRHKPTGESDPEKMIFAYAIGKINGSDIPVIECWSNDRLKKHFEKYNKVGKRHYAWENWEMYARKVVLLQVLKYLPQSVELSDAIDMVHKSEVVVNGAVNLTPGNANDALRKLEKSEETENIGADDEDKSEAKAREYFSKANTVTEVNDIAESLDSNGYDAAMIEHLEKINIARTEGGE